MRGGVTEVGGVVRRDPATYSFSVSLVSVSLRPESALKSFTKRGPAA